MKSMNDITDDIMLDPDYEDNDFVDQNTLDAIDAAFDKNRKSKKKVKKSQPGPADVHQSVGMFDAKKKKRKKIGKSFDEIYKARKKSIYGPGKNPNSHKNRRVGGRNPISREEMKDRYSSDPKVRGAATVKEFMRKARLAKEKGNIKGARTWAHSARIAMRSTRAGFLSSSQFRGLRDPINGEVIKRVTKSELNEKRTMIEKRMKSGYAPGKNPNSHRRSAGSSVNRRLTAESSVMRDGNRYSATAEQFGRKAKANMMYARAAKDAGNKGKASYHAGVAREMVRRMRAAKEGYQLHGYDATRGLKNTKGNNSHYRAQTMGDKYGRSGVEHHKTSAKQSSRKARMTKRMKSGYAPGKNPNSHKRSAGNHGAKKDWGHGGSYSGKINRSLRQAREAKASGNMGAASEHAYQARHMLRTLRNWDNSRHFEPTGLKRTAGARIYSEGKQAEQKAKTSMDRARRAKLNHNKRSTADEVENARSAHQASKTLLRTARMTKRHETDIFVPIVKADAKEQVVYGWASPVRQMGSDIIDRQGDVIDMSEVRQAAHEFMLHKRVSGSMHKQMDAGQVVESIVFDADIQKALGIELPYEGWFIGVKVSKKEDWEKVESGEYTGFSIGGSGIREPMETEVTKARSKSGYGPGKNPNSHKRRLGTSSARDKKVIAETGKKGKQVTFVDYQGKKGNESKTYANRARQALMSAKDAIRAARDSKAKGDLGAASHYAEEARRFTRGARLSNQDGIKSTEGAGMFREARRRIDRNEWGGYDLRAKARVTKRMKSGYAPGKNPNSHRRKGGVARAKHLNSAKDWMAEARDVKSYDPDQAAYAVMQARKAVRRARGASTKTGSGKSTLARAARRFATQSVDGR